MYIAHISYPLWPQEAQTVVLYMELLKLL